MKFYFIGVLVVALLAAGWFAFDAGRDLSDARAAIESIRNERDDAARQRDALVASLAALSKSNTNVRIIQDRVQIDVEAIQALPSTGRCGEPVHAAVDQLRAQNAEPEPQ